MVLLGLMTLGILSRKRAKERVLGLFVRGMTADSLNRSGEAFARERMPAMLRPAAMEKLAWHRSRGHHCVLLTASPTPYVAPWARGAGFDDVIATGLEVDAAGLATGRIAGENCRGEEKLRRL